MNKRLLFSMAFMLCVSFAFSQIKVVAPNGDVGVGTSTPQYKLDVNGEVFNKGFIVEKSGASASASFQRVGYSAFAMGAGVQAGFTFDRNYAIEFRANDRSFVLNRSISTGDLIMRLRGNTLSVGIGTNANATYKLRVAGDVGATNFITTSDRRLKKNIKDFKFGLEEILQINPKTYQYNGLADIDTDKLHIGVIAQELQEIIPVAVSEFDYENEDKSINTNYLAVDNAAIQYMLVNAVKEQQEIIEDQEEKIQDLESRLEQIEDLLVSLSQEQGFQSIELQGSKDVYLNNSPNPFNGITTIEYQFPEGSSQVAIQILDTQGKLLKKVDLDGTVMKGQVEVKADTLPSGTYNYVLIADGQVLSTKKMVLTK